MYLVSFLWISTTITTQGVVGDLLPQTYSEMGFAMMLMLLSVTAFNYVVGTIGTHVMSWDQDIVKQRNKLGAVSAYLQAKGLHGELMRQIVSYFSSSEVISNMPMSKIMPSLNLGLQHEVASFIAGDYLKLTPLFRSCSGPMLDNLQLLLRDLDFLGGEIIYKQGSVAHEMYIVIRGDVCVTVTDDMGNEEEERVLGIGESVGDLECFFQMRHSASCKASYLGARCLRLAREKLMTILKMHPDDERTISSNAAQLVASAKKALHNRSASSRATRSIATSSSFGRSSRNSGRSQASKASKAQSAHSARLAKSGLETAERDNDMQSSSSTDLDTKSLSQGSSESHDSFNELMDNEISQAVFSLSARRQKEQLITHFTHVARGDLDKVQKGIEDGISVDATDPNGRTALHIAASSGQYHIVRYLLERNAQTQIVDIYKNNPLADAVRSKQDSIAQLLLEHDVEAELVLTDGGGNAVQLLNAVFHQDMEQIKRLINFGVSVNDKDYDGRTALHIAASEGFVDVVEYLLDANADVNAIDRFGGSPLADAVRDRHSVLHQTLESSHTKDVDLSMAARHDHHEVQEVLRLTGGKLMGIDTGVLLCEMAAEGNLDELKAYCENGVDINSQDYDGRTALHLAAANGKVNVLDYLLMRADVEVNSLDRYNGTPLDDAIRHQRDVAKTMLLAHGGLSKYDPQLAEMIERLNLEKKDRAKSTRRLKIEDQLLDTPEGRASIWVKGRCGKLIPMA